MSLYKLRTEEENVNIYSRERKDIIDLVTYYQQQAISADNSLFLAHWVRKTPTLEDIDEDSGPLTYYAGSHKLPYVLNKDYAHNSNHYILDKKRYEKYENAIEEIIEKNKLKKEKFLAKKGDIFVWHANLLHGGSPINNIQLTRKSMVLHFYTEDVICYHEITERPAIFNDTDAHCPPATNTN